jgi:hypothetical protein
MLRAPALDMLPVATVALLLAGAAHAVELSTTWVGASGPERIRCRVVNVGRKPVQVLAEVIDQTGANVATTTFAGCDGVAPLPPNGICSAFANGPVAGYCRFTSSSKRIRAAINLEVQSASQLLNWLPATR